MADLKNNLHFNSQGEEVKHLHRNLAILGVPIAEEELENKVFGTTTARAITEFQDKYKLEVTGVADETTIGEIVMFVVHY